MADRREVWESKRPVFSSLPAYGYQNNDVTDWVTSWVDQELSKVSDTLQNFHENIDPATCPESLLDYLAWMVGLSNQFWDVTWQPSVKRAMIANAHYLFNHLGTLDTIRKVLDIHGLPYDIWTDGNLTLPFTLPGTFGKPRLRYFVRVPISVNRNGRGWMEVKRTIRNYSAAVVKGSVSHEAFRLNYSRLGDPLFRAS